MIAIIDLGIGNISSIANIIRKCQGESFVCRDHRDLSKATKIILPGVGSFDYAVNSLSKGGWTVPLHDAVLGEKKKVLGICLGMQLMCLNSEEGKLDGLGWLKARVVRFKFGQEENLKIPHMGWNTVQISKGNDLLVPAAEESRFYFVHSYHVACDEERDVAGTTHYGYNFTSIFSKDNIYGVQFHPEKSHRFGIGLIRNFVALK